MINVGKAISIMFWALVIFVFVTEPAWEMTSLIKIIGLITINIHILESFWFLSWKETNKLRRMWFHILQILLFGAF
ncbi:MAG: DUF1145 domain-containing protein, partial [Chitinophagales bacterium]